MAVLFSAVTLTADNNQVEFLAAGIPRDSDDLEGWTAYENFMDELDSEQEVSVHVEAYLYGEGETFKATPEEVAYFKMRADADEDFMSEADKVSLVVTTPPSFSINARTTMNVVQSMINGAERNILITGYALSSYFSELVDTIVHKSQRGVFVKFFVNDIDKQLGFDKILRYKGRFLKIYN